MGAAAAAVSVGQQVCSRAVMCTYTQHNSAHQHGPAAEPCCCPAAAATQEAACPPMMRPLGHSAVRQLLGNVRGVEVHPAWRGQQALLQQTIVRAKKTRTVVLKRLDVCASPSLPWTHPSGDCSAAVQGNQQPVVMLWFGCVPPPIVSLCCVFSTRLVLCVALARSPRRPCQAAGVRV